MSLKCVLYKKNIKDGSDVYEVFLKALNSTIYNESYRAEILLKEGPYLLGCTRYPEYPVKIFENREFWVSLEGKIYDKHELNDEMNELMNRIFSNGSTTEKGKKIIADWLLQTDGDFIIYALNKKTRDFVILNDVLGRLPLYYYCNHEAELIVSRELPFISYLIQDDSDNANKFDRMGIAQYLLIGYPLGKRTLLRNIYRLEPATILRIRNNSEIKIDNIYRLNFENKKYAKQGIEKNAQELVSLFSKACKNRADYNAKNIIFLSGGFDSRGVLACFHKNNIPGYGVTLPDPEWTPVVGNLSEAEIAEQLAKSLNFEWENYDFIKPQAEDLLRLLRIKNGLPYLAYSFLLPSLDKLKHKHDSSANSIFMGHGGEIIRQFPYRKEVKELDSLVRTIVRSQRSFSLSDVATIVQLKESEIVDEIRNIVSSYPEENLNKKFMHYFYCEMTPKLAFEEEDILRFYFWTACPYFSIPFFNYAMNCPDEIKSKERLYREFLFMLCPSLAAISTSNWGCSILSKRYKILQFIFSLMWRYRRFSKIIDSILSLTWNYRMFNKFIIKIKDNMGDKDNSSITRCIQEQINNCHAISKYLSSTGVEKIVNNYSNYGRIGIQNMFTITSLMEKTFCNNSTIEKYYDN